MGIFSYSLDREGGLDQDELLGTIAIGDLARGGFKIECTYVDEWLDELFFTFQERGKTVQTFSDNPIVHYSFDGSRILVSFERRHVSVEEHEWIAELKIVAKSLLNEIEREGIALQNPDLLRIASWAGYRVKIGNG